MDILLNIEKSLSGEPSYRLKQARAAFFKELITDWGQASSLPVLLREKLSKDCPILIKTYSRQSDSSNSFKALIDFDDVKIETVLIKHRTGRNTVCVSSQAGCVLNCAFCTTGQQGFKRNLMPGEIVSQVVYWARELKETKERVENVVFMGMGEPFLNYDNVIEAIKILNDDNGLNIGARHISISTAGIVPGILKLAAEPLQVNLAISLHAPDNELRNKLMPINKKYNIEAVLKAVEQYVNRTNRRVMFEYLLLEGINDSLVQAKRLAVIVNKPLYLVNLLRYNPTGSFIETNPTQAKRFQSALEEAGVKTTFRLSFGTDISAACGQLSSRAWQKKNDKL